MCFERKPGVVGTHRGKLLSHAQAHQNCVGPMLGCEIALSPTHRLTIYERFEVYGFMHGYGQIVAGRIGSSGAGAHYIVSIFFKLDFYYKLV